MTSTTRNASRVTRPDDDESEPSRAGGSTRTDVTPAAPKTAGTSAATGTTGTAEATEAAGATPEAVPAAPRRRLGPLLPARLRRLGRPHLLVELIFSVVLYKTYSLTRRAAPEHHEAALHRATDILNIERTLHVDIELTINHALDKVTWLIVGMNYYYATLHFIVTLGVLIWLYARHPASYRSARTALYAATFLALIGFTFFALAPPRLMEGQNFIDTVVTHHTWGSWDSKDVSSLSNQYAAMPSVHIVWSAWSGLTVAALARRTWVRVLGILYPFFTFTVILATGNHFLADAVAGAVTLSLGFLIQRLLLGRPAYVYPAPDPLPAGAAAPGPHPARVRTGDRADR
ncbi:PAP2 superfamily protein [Actinacidiphila alni]|uniref:PAP2 superfamily protein n=1 Tax=Actinacidiphila alni TaxID=380248 RepID=A0A1I1YQG0_9ACTN|nr:phosphatase PAP2 family protein [Actinacidiphila alni]SFE21258.1 PAP2 superfamily protein [Actinacidiphila alni]